MKKWPSANSRCLDEVLATIQEGDFKFTLKFYSLFDVLGTYFVILEFKDKPIVNIADTSHFTAITEMLSKIDELKNGKYQNSIKDLENLSLKIYNEMVNLNGNDLERASNAGN